VAEVLVAELGTDMSRFPSAAHAAAWAGVAPGNNESGGKRRSGKTRQGNNWLRVALVQAAHGAARTKDTYLGAQYRRLVPRLGNKRAVMALAHSILVSAYHMLCKREGYHDLGAEYFARRKPEARVKHLSRQIEKLGYQVTLQPAAGAA
jgi:transposase